MVLDLECRQAKVKEWKFYERNRKKAYFGNVWKPVKERRFGPEYYDLYHFFMPERTFWQVRLLKKYFYALDALTSADAVENRFRKTPIEIFDTAIDVLDLMRQSTWTYTSHYLGSDHISPLAWACIGHDRDKRITCRHHFQTFFDLCKFYDKELAAEKQFNILRVYRKQSNTYDKLTTFATSCDVSYNRILAVAIAFLFDLIISNGPDSECYTHLYTNNRAVADIETWKLVYDHVVKPRITIPEYRKNNIYNRCCRVELRCLYSDVLISDVHTDFPTRLPADLIRPDFEI